MSRNILNFFSVVMASRFLLAALAAQAQMQNGSPLAGQNGSLNRNGMSPYMKSNGPMAPQNNVQFIERNTFGGMSRNIRVETSMSQLALKNNHNDQIYLTQMDGYVRKDQQAGHAAYAMMDLSRVSHVGSQVWALSNEEGKANRHAGKGGRLQDRLATYPLRTGQTGLAA